MSNLDGLAVRLADGNDENLADLVLHGLALQLPPCRRYGVARGD